ncbi:hypothetical protein HK103_005215 [Boothiomyces macroporosus]|uniref:Uncharacterized protein n=1 Tax=Boothiomyces macroporosus TaxID=261099 RepID=A0AAD5UIH8_9FUNG|nr:hypothetical protein HK103_005215 [Boothiomyces macroporosus]
MDPPAYSPPQKYIKINGITKLNPAYIQWQERNGQQPIFGKDQQGIAIPYISTLKDYEDYNKVDASAQFSESVQASMEIAGDEQFCKNLGLNPGSGLDQLSIIFGKYEIPLGLLSKLFELQTFDTMEFLIDDSGSMICNTDSQFPNGKKMTRFEEAKERLMDIIKIIAYIQTPKIYIRFLNRHNVIQHERQFGVKPETFIADIGQEIDRVFSKPPNGSTPFLEKIQESLCRYPKQRAVRYFFGDGQPNGGQAAIDEIVKIITNRQNPQDNPITFVSCTSEDQDVEWMKDCEEWAPYCAEIDDYMSEKNEVLGDQGLAFPFSRGFYLLALIVGAMNPEDLDAMDESSPMTKFTLDNLLGMKYSREEYRNYWQYFMLAQSKKPQKYKWDWERHFEQFATAQTSACNLPIVKSYRQKVMGPSKTLFYSTPRLGVKPKQKNKFLSFLGL